MKLFVVAILVSCVVIATADNAYNTTCYQNPSFNYYKPDGSTYYTACSTDRINCNNPNNNSGFIESCKGCCQVFMQTRATTTTKNNQVTSFVTNSCTCNCCIYTKN